MIKLQNLYKYYNTNDIVTLALRNINLELHKNEIVSIIGESGSGKSTLLNVICGVDSYDEGEMYYKGNETSYFSSDDIELYRKNNVAFIYQSYNIIESYTVLDNVVVPLLLDGLSYDEAKEEAIKIIEKVGLTERLYNKGANLSGGEKQRCVIARALASKCEILACDEPTGNLDSKTGDSIIELIKEIANDKLVLIVTHNYEQVDKIATRTIKMSDGQIVEDYSKENIEYEPEIGDIDLEEETCPKKTLGILSFKNIITKVKSSIFSSTVFLILSFLVFFLALANVYWNDTNKYNPVSGFTNTMYNRVVVLDKNRETINMDVFNKINGNIYVNSFYEDKLVSFKLIGNHTHESTIKGCFSPEMPKDYIHSYGEIPSKEKDIYFLFPEKLQNAYIEKFVTYVGYGFELSDPKISLGLTLCGYGYSKEVSNPTFVTYDDISDELNKLDLMQINATADVLIDNKLQTVEVEQYYNKNRDKLTLFFNAPNESDLVNLYMEYNATYKELLDKSEYDVYYIPSNEFGISIEIPYTYETNEVYELSIYSDNPDEVIKIAKKNGYIAIQVGKGGIDNTSNEQGYALIFMAVSIVIGIILVFISYIVLAKIYSNKIKDYNIFRSLGYTKKDMRKMVNYEVLIISVISSILSISIMYTVSLLSESIRLFLMYNSLSIIGLYFVFMILLALFISRKFNKKLFKFTLHKTFYNKEVL